MMARALQLAQLGRFWARPNPHVGCVLVREGHVIGEGFTQPAGGNHAEVEALRAAGDARGATAYVTLEPCNHHGKTGPCTEALVAAGVKRVVAATCDPNPLVAGSGLARLEAAGVEVQSGLLEAEARELMAGFIARMERGRGRLRLKLAMSLDGRTAMASGESQWITGAAARRDVQRLRAASCAIVTGIGTVLADDCSLTVRSDELGLDAEQQARAEAVPPLRVVLDSGLRTPADAAVLAAGNTLLLHGADVESDKPLDAELLALPSAEEGRSLDLKAVVAELAQRQCNEILVESGPRLAGALLREGLVDEMLIYVAPVILGEKARPLLGLSLDKMAEKVNLDWKDSRKVGNDWRFRVIPRG